MDLPTPSKSAPPLSVIGPQYCASSGLQLRIGTTVQKTSSDGNFVVTDVNGSVIFKVQEKKHTMHGRQVLVDGAGNSIVTIRERTVSAHKTWKVFKGEREEKSNLIFTVKRSAMLGEKNKLHVFLAKNIKEDVFDFKIEKSQSEDLLLVYRGESSPILAEMHKRNTTRSASIRKDNYAVTIFGNIDYAFIIALIVIHNECDEKKGKNESDNNWLRPLGKWGLGLLQDLGVAVASDVLANELLKGDENQDQVGELLQDLGIAVASDVLANELLKGDENQDQVGELLQDLGIAVASDVLANELLKGEENQDQVGELLQDLGIAVASDVLANELLKGDENQNQVGELLQDLGIAVASDVLANELLEGDENQDQVGELLQDLGIAVASDVLANELLKGDENQDQVGELLQDLGIAVASDVLANELLKGDENQDQVGEGDEEGSEEEGEEEDEEGSEEEGEEEDEDGSEEEGEEEDEEGNEEEDEEEEDESD